MSTISTRVTKLIDVTSVGDNSITGSIYQEHGQEVFEKMTAFLWVILCPFEDIEKATAQAKELGVTYIIAERDNSVNNI